MAFLAVSEWATVKATLVAIDEKKYRCGSCLTEYTNRADGEKMLQASRDSKGCFGVKDYKVLSLSDGISFKTCPGNFYSKEVAGLLEAFRSYERGVMPFQGALFDQPAKVIEVFGLFSTHRAEQAEQASRRKAMKERSRGR